MEIKYRLEGVKVRAYIALLFLLSVVAVILVGNWYPDTTFTNLGIVVLTGLLGLLLSEAITDVIVWMMFRSTFGVKPPSSHREDISFAIQKLVNERLYQLATRLQIAYQVETSLRDHSRNASELTIAQVKDLGHQIYHNRARIKVIKGKFYDARNLAYQCQFRVFDSFQPYLDPKAIEVLLDPQGRDFDSGSTRRHYSTEEVERALSKRPRAVGMLN